MSKSQPLLKELKGYATKLLIECPKPIVDEDPLLFLFCECFERILYKGLYSQKSVIALLRLPECWHWLEQLANEKWGIPYSYTLSVEEIQKCERVQTNRGRVRLLIRMCLMRRCLHVPVQFLVNEDRCCLLYNASSILGDSIMASVLTSALLCTSTIPFDLQLHNSLFLDSTWHLPPIISITFVPTPSLGLSVMFINGRALILSVLEYSVAAENGNVKAGDLLDSVNGVVINKNNQGSLSSVIKKSAKKPITVIIVKSVMDGKLYPPIVPLLRESGLDPALIQSRDSIEIRTDQEDMVAIQYVGSTSTGSDADIKQIYLAINNFNFNSQTPLPVNIECYHLGIKVVSLIDNQVIHEHTYMEISSCGCSSSYAPYFAYIAGDKNYTECKEFVCHIFYSKNAELVDSLLKTIAQGFRRTLYTV